jgi:putative flippase GtrA
VTEVDDEGPGGFWLLDRVIGSEFGLKVTKYAIGSVIALVTSVVVFALLLWAGVGTTADSVAAFLAGAIPNWILNRRWAWERSDQKLDVTREVVGYTLVSLVSLLAASAGTGWTHTWVDHHIRKGDGARVIVVTGAYVLVQAILFLGKFVVYDRWVFTGESRFRTAIRARLARRNAEQQTL